MLNSVHMHTATAPLWKNLRFVEQKLKQNVRSKSQIRFLHSAEGACTLRRSTTACRRWATTTRRWPGNQNGSYLTMWSSGGLQFEVIFFFSALSQMLVDQSYWQSAIAAKPTAAVKVGARPIILCTQYF